MSELITTQPRANSRLQLLATVSALSLMAATIPQAKAEDADRPVVWLSGGYHLDTTVGKADPFVPQLDAAVRKNGFPSLTDIENALSRSGGAEGAVSFQPKGSDWLFTVSGRYGRSHTARDIHPQKAAAGPQMKKSILNGFDSFNTVVTPVFQSYVQQSGENSQTHAIVDFQVGKDVGVGLWGRGTETIVSFGARYAQFNARSQSNGYAAVDPNFEQITSVGVFLPEKYRIRTHHPASASVVERSANVRALGPTLSMSNTTPLTGDVSDGQMALEWGANAALLFGRQRAKVSHQSTVQQLTGYMGVKNIAATPVVRTRSRTVTIPNLGGFAALSYRFTNAKISAGYRADFFFGAMDGGLDTHKSMTTGFHGPFAKISVGLGG